MRAIRYVSESNSLSCRLNGGESGIRYAVFTKTLSLQRQAKKRSLYRHFRCITSVTCVTKKSSVDHGYRVYGMDGMDAALSLSGTMSHKIRQYPRWSGR